MTVSHATEKLVNDVKDIVREGETRLRETGRELTGKTREGLKKSLATAKDSCRKAEDELKLVAKRTDAAVHKYPYAAVGIGAAIGLVIGALILRRK